MKYGFVAASDRATSTAGHYTFHGQRTTVMGLGHHGGGVAVARYLYERGAVVTVSDEADERVLWRSLSRLSDCTGLCVHVGGHHEADFRDADLVVVNPAVLPGNRFVRQAQDHGVEVTSEIDLFLQTCRAHVIGVTGTNGKSTTAAMIAAILQAAGHRCHLGGNVGTSLLGEVDSISASDWIVLELSSFQLARLRDDTPGVEVAVVTGCSPHHLDWHGSFEAYMTAKQRLLTTQPRNVGTTDQPTVAVIDDRDAGVRDWSTLARGRCLTSLDLSELPPLLVPGEHNRRNAALAAGAAQTIGCSRSAIDNALAQFRGLPHRLQRVATLAGRRLVDDSQATTPEATIAGLGAMSEPVWLLLGGYEKGVDFSGLAAEVAARAAGACCFGAAGGRIAAEIRGRDACFPVHQVRTLQEAFAWCWQNTQPGDCVMLSPACASFDQFRDAQERSRRFAELAASAPLDRSPSRTAAGIENYL